MKTKWYEKIPLEFHHSTHTKTHHNYLTNENHSFVLFTKVPSSVRKPFINIISKVGKIQLIPLALFRAQMTDGEPVSASFSQRLRTCRTNEKNTAVSISKGSTEYAHPCNFKIIQQIEEIKIMATSFCLYIFDLWAVNNKEGWTNLRIHWSDNKAKVNNTFCELGRYCIHFFYSKRLLLLNYLYWNNFIIRWDCLWFIYNIIMN